MSKRARSVKEPRMFKVNSSIGLLDVMAVPLEVKKTKSGKVLVLDSPLVMTLDNVSSVNWSPLVRFAQLGKPVKLQAAAVLGSATPEPGVVSSYFRAIANLKKIGGERVAEQSSMMDASPRLQ